MTDTITGARNRAVLAVSTVRADLFEESDTVSAWTRPRSVWAANGAHNLVAHLDGTRADAEAWTDLAERAEAGTAGCTRAGCDTCLPQGRTDPPAGWTEVAGIFVGGCVERGVGSRFRAKGHAHCVTGDRHLGWICVLSAKRLWTPDGDPSRLLWHEYAHILTGGAWHDDRWRATMRRLGQPIPEQYRKKTRR